MQEVPRFFESFEIGETRKTLARTITETDFVVHAGHSGDFFPHHMDEEFCKINPHDITYGYERLRFPKPVFIGDTIHTELEITKAQIDPKREGYGQVVEACSVKNQNGETVLFCEHILLVKRDVG